MGKGVTYSNDSVQRLENVCPVEALELIAVHIVGDVLDELGEEGDFKDFVESDELQVGKTISADIGGWSSVRERSLSLNLDVFQGIVARVWEAILKRKIERCSRCQGKESS